jgi:DNA-binding IclR family transcriptional regulator
MESGNSDVPAIEKMDAVLSVLLDQRRGMTQAEICIETSLAKASVSRLVNALQVRGYLEIEDGRISLGPKLILLGGAASRRVDLVERSRAKIKALSEEIREMVKLSVLRGSAVFPLLTCESPDPIRITLDSGSHFPPYIGAAGKLLLALSEEGFRYLDEVLPTVSMRTHTDFSITDHGQLLAALDDIRSRGFATDLQEETPGIYAIAAPIYDAGSRVIAALSIPFFGDFDDKTRRYLPLLQQYAAEISVSLGHHPQEDL